MNEETKSGWWRSSYFKVWLALFALIVVAMVIAKFTTNAPKHPPYVLMTLLFGVLGASIPVGLLWLVRWLRCWRNVRRLLIGLAVLATLVAIFYTEESWRGKRAWENCKHELEAKGEVLDWSAYIPPPVPDDQNIFKAPKMQQWFVGRGWTELSKRLTNSATALVGTSKNDITNKAEASSYVEWCNQLEPDFNLIREALKRPYARMDGNYEHPYEIPIPNFITIRNLAQTLAQRTHCYLLLKQPQDALRDLTLLHDLNRLLEGKPTGKPMTLIAAMINVAVTGLYVNAIADGLQLQAWREPQLVAIQEQLRAVNLIPIVAESFRDERAADSHTFEKNTPTRIADPIIISAGGKTNFWERLNNPFYSFLTFAPRGWTYQNMITFARMFQPAIESFDLKSQLILPHKANHTGEAFQKLRLYSPCTFLVARVLPPFLKATQTLARNQTTANQALVACALERNRLARGEYPETLNALTPQFIEKIPHDIIGGQPLKYRRTDNPPSPAKAGEGAAIGQFVLYSVGWNETDDGGITGRNKDGSEDREQGDWVWGAATR